ncbi:hypothetical protein [Spongiibacter marinus]|uniref:hypothetical protein n=1 Tax=Spongiibacter marinus TaxID=354246 RepID=UPI003C6A8D18
MDLSTLQKKVDSIRPYFPDAWEVSCATEVASVYFPHMIIDNFFTEEELDEIRKHQAPVTGKEINISHSLIESSGEIKSSVFDSAFLTAVDQRYRRPLQAILGELCGSKQALYEFSDFHMVSTGPDYQHAIHDDIPKKLLSVVIYISPEHNNGTFIHQSRYDSTPVGEVEWKPNRAFVFSRVDRKTWHSYAANKRDQRFCVIYNLNVRKAYKAHWAEGNYLKFLEKFLKNE